MIEDDDLKKIMKMRLKRNFGWKKVGKGSVMDWRRKTWGWMRWNWRKMNPKVRGKAGFALILRLKRLMGLMKGMQDDEIGLWGH